MTNTEQLISKALPGFADLAPSFREAEGRPIRIRAVKVVDYVPTNPKSDKQLVAPGTATAFFAKKGSKILKEIEKAARAGNGSDEEIAQRLAKQFASRSPVSLSEAVRSLQSQPVFGDLRYGGATLARNIFVPEDFEVSVIPFPYNGGRLATEGFKFVERYDEKRDGQIDTLILRYLPPLSRAEEAALKKVPANQLELNVGSATNAANTVEIVLMVLLYMLLMQPADLAEQHIDEQRIKEIGSGATA